MMVHLQSVEKSDSSQNKKNRFLSFHRNENGLQSGRWDLNPGPLAPHASALAGLRHAPI